MASILRVVDAGLDDRLGDDRHDRLDMGTAGDLGHDTAIALMDLDLLDTTEDMTSVPSHDGGRRLVTAGLDAENAVGGQRGGSIGDRVELSSDLIEPLPISGESRSWSHMMMASSVGRS